MNRLTEASGGIDGLHRVLLHNQVKTSKTGVSVFKRVNGWYWRVNENENWWKLNDETFCRMWRVVSGK